MSEIRIDRAALLADLSRRCHALEAENATLRQDLTRARLALAAQDAAHRELQQAYLELGRAQQDPDYLRELRALAAGERALTTSILSSRWGRA